jgi:predicted DNA-binding protein (MmcQ/YjbR family)
MTSVWKVKDGETVVCVMMTETEADECMATKIQDKARENLLSNAGVPMGLMLNKGKLGRLCDDMSITTEQVDAEKSNVTQFTKESTSV